MNILAENQKNILSTDKKNLTKLLKKFNKISQNLLFKSLSPTDQDYPFSISYIIDFVNVSEINNIIEKLNKINNFLELYVIIKQHKFCYIF